MLSIPALELGLVRYMIAGNDFAVFYHTDCKLVQYNGVYVMSFQIITDSCCDLTQAQYEAWNVACVPLTVTYNGESHQNFPRALPSRPSMI